MTTSLTVSVVMPTYNRADALPRAIESVLGQTFEDFELIVVDDASTDATEEVVRRYDDDRIRYIRFEENRGANAARNAGIRAADGEFVSFLDSDDELLPENLERTTERLRRAPSTCVGVFTSYAWVDDGEVVNVSRAREGTITHADVAARNVIGGFSCTMFRASVFEGVGYLDEKFRSIQDYDFFIRTLEGHTMVGIREVLVRYHVSDDRIGDNLDRKLQGQERFLRKHEHRLSSRGIANMYYQRAMAYVRNGEIKNARRDLIRAIGTDPLNWRPWYHFVPLLLGRWAFDVAYRVKIETKLLLHALTRSGG